MESCDIVTIVCTYVISGVSLGNMDETIVQTLTGENLFRLPKQIYHVGWVQPSERFDCTEHTHNGFSEILICTQGRFRHRVNGECFTHETGDVVFIRERDIHSLRGTGFHMINVAFPNWWFEELTQAWGTPDWINQLHASERPPKTCVDTNAQKRFAAAARDLTTHRDEWRGRMLFARFLVSTFADHFLTRLTFTPAGQPSAPGWLMETLAWLDEHRETLPDLGQLVDRCGRSREHVARSFRRCLGLSPSQYLNRQRLRRAAELLVHGSASVLEVSLSAGFENLSYFHRLFRERYSVSPERYRKEHSAMRLLPS